MEKPGPSTNKTTQARRSLGETESKTRPSNSPQAVVKLPPKVGERKALPVKANESVCVNRVAEAKACVVKAKLAINNSRNLKTDIKNDVLEAIDRLFSLVKESEANDPKSKGTKAVELREQGVAKMGCERLDRQLLEKIEEQNRLLQENKDEIARIGTLVQENQKHVTYANAVTSRQYPAQRAPMHSIVVTSKDEMETGDQVLEKVRKAVNAKEEGVKIDRVRKARDRKVVLGCKTEEERDRIKKRLASVGEMLKVEDVKNRDPLVILRDVLTYNTDEDILKALRNQNKEVFVELKKEEDRVEVLFKKKTRNPHTHHVVLRVSPKLWTRLQDRQTVHIDLQRIRVSDQTPLIQCSLCLGFGHGRRLCKEQIEKCSHCGGPHMRTQCEEWMAGTVPSCCNCVRAKQELTDHNAFSDECPVRKRCEVLARARVAYC